MLTVEQRVAFSDMSFPYVRSDIQGCTGHHAQKKPNKLGAAFKTAKIRILKVQEHDG